MSVLIAVVCFVIGFIVAIFKLDWLFPAWTWFFASLAASHLALPGLPVVFQKKAE